MTTEVKPNAEDVATHPKLQIVGVDGSPGSMHALRWALAHSSTLGDVEPLVAWRYPWWALVPAATGTLTPLQYDDFSRINRRVAENMLAGTDGSRTQPVVVVHRSAGPALVAAGDRGSIIVVGSRGRGATTARLLGSVGAFCVHHANVPVAVVPPDASLQDRYNRVVVGVDGSEHGRRAVAWALANTPATARIDLLHAWTGSALAPQLSPTRARDSQELVRAAVEEAAATVGACDREVRGVSKEGDPRIVVHDEAAAADLVVVGARGRGPIDRLLLGSVASYLVHQPATATVVVR